MTLQTSRFITAFSLTLLCATTHVGCGGPDEDAQSLTALATLAPAEWPTAITITKSIPVFKCPASESMVKFAAEMELKKKCKDLGLTPLIHVLETSNLQCKPSSPGASKPNVATISLTGLCIFAKTASATVTAVPPFCTAANNAAINKATKAAQQFCEDKGEVAHVIKASSVSCGPCGSTAGKLPLENYCATVKVKAVCEPKPFTTTAWSCAIKALSFCSVVEEKAEILAKQEAKSKCEAEGKKTQFLSDGPMGSCVTPNGPWGDYEWICAKAKVVARCINFN
jgi:hypothetical protein